VIERGELAPGFELTAQDGSMFSLASQLEHGPVVLYFYPKAMTPGCTRESIHFRDRGADFAELGAARIGISADDIEAQSRFVSTCALDFPLLSDPDRSVARAYGVRRAGPLFNKRVTFVIDADATILDVISSETNMDVHADRAIEALRARGGPVA
jgi:peroxiredoxin Q/BCP